LFSKILPNSLKRQQSLAQPLFPSNRSFQAKRDRRCGELGWAKLLYSAVG